MELTVRILLLHLHPLAGGTDLETRFHQTYDPLIPELREVSQQKFDNGTLSGLEITYQRPWGEPWWQFHDLWVEKDAVIYVLSFHGSPNDFEIYRDDFELILQILTSNNSWFRD